MGIRDLATTLHLSIATVSRALNGSPEVSARTRRRVLEAAARTGYSAQHAGRSLRQGRSETVGLMLPARGPSESYTLSLFFPVAAGIQSVLADRALDLVLIQGRSDEEELQQVRRIVSRRAVDGLIVAGTRAADPRVDLLAERGFPFVTWGRTRAAEAHAWVDLDFEAGAEAAVSHLAALGHRRLALGVPGEGAMQGVVYARAFAQAARRAGLAEADALVRRTELSERGGYRVTGELMAGPRPPTALLFQSDSMAIGAYRRLRELGLQPGRDVAVSGGVLTGELADYLSPPLSGFRIALGPLGVRLGQALLDRLERPAAPPVQERWPMERVARESDATGPRRG